MNIRWPIGLRRALRRWRADTRGTSMVTTAITLPLLIVILFGIWYLFWWLMVKQALHNGVRDAAQFATEEGRYWNISEESGIESEEILPQDYYDIEARRMVENRIRDIGNWTSSTLQSALVVRVDEPILAHAPDKAPEVPIDEGYIDSLCDPDVGNPSSVPGSTDYRLPENIRLRVWAELSLPVLPVRIPYMDMITVTLRDRAIGYVQCPRWRGRREAGVEDQSRKVAAEYPYLPVRFPSTPSYPTVTVEPPPGTSTPLPPSPTPP